MKTFLKILFDLVFRLGIIMGVVIGYEVGCAIDSDPLLSDIVLFTTGFAAAGLIGLYGRLWEKYVKYW